jgi:hypothetical protein
MLGFELSELHRRAFGNSYFASANEPVFGRQLKGEQLHCGRFNPSL